MAPEPSYRRLELRELVRVGEIDRRERISSLFTQRGAHLEEREVAIECPPWHADGSGEHSVAYQQAECERLVRAGGVALGAVSDEQLVGLGVVLPHVRPGVAQLAFLYVSNDVRGSGVGVTLNEELERLARAEGATSIVVSATPTGNTVRFYRARGYEPMADPLPELLEREPEDIHMRKEL